MLLACADPGTGEISRPEFFDRALSGAVLAALELCGVITIEDLRIVELRPVTLGEPVLDSLSEQLVFRIRRGQPDKGRPGSSAHGRVCGLCAPNCPVASPPAWPRRHVSASPPP
ncbi:hypothetical protein ACIBBB_05570 [Streptomyces sp. NPDC051217]|uniref:hypothetical protein n=1 Tax=Streptomyces sp. NPDC051217 TaxID=3365644 RepID=UPI0037924889